MPGINATQIARVRGYLPPHRYSQDELVSYTIDILGEQLGRPAKEGVVRRMFANAGVQARHLTMPLDYYRQQRTIVEALADVQRAVLDLGTTAITETLAEAGVAPGEVDMLAVTSSLALGTPTIDFELAERTGLRPDVRRLPLGPSGCSGGAALVAWMHAYLAAHPDRLAVGFVADLPWFAGRLAPPQLSRIVESALLGDGGAVIVMAGAERAAPGLVTPWVLDSTSAIWPNSRDDVYWRLEEGSLTSGMSQRTVDAAEESMPVVVDKLLAGRALAVADIDAWVMHPGSLKVLQHIAAALGIKEDALEDSRRVLSRAGNMSGATVLHVLAEAGQSPRPEGTWGLLAALGPGLVCEAALLRWGTAATMATPALAGAAM
ncbi:MAG TPA: 3-oxoacyl-[acyl-carrier-protein] synthase III C-terminal domain-containing protein [Trebonia sp.]|nr:3-oxoacyl-[acyl-carrier-protein] synthase III C-terminal domain-containing protein [Trebonia sp.]